MSTLLNGLLAFLEEHRYRGRLGSGVEHGRVWMTCNGCGAEVSHSVVGADRLPAYLAAEGSQ